MFYNTRKALAYFLHPEGEAIRIKQRDTEDRLRAALDRAELKASSLGFQCNELNAKLQSCTTKAANWDYLVKSHESGDIDAFVVFVENSDGLLEPVTCEVGVLDQQVSTARNTSGTIAAI